MTMSKKLALFLALVIALCSISMAGCGKTKKTDDTENNTDEISEIAINSDYELRDIIEGEWRAPIDLKTVMNYQAEQSEDDEAKEIFKYFDFSNIEFELTLTFDHGETKMKYDFEKSKDRLRKALFDGYMKYAKKMFEEEYDLYGAELEEALAEIEDQANSDVDELMIDIEEDVSEGYYRISGKKIFFADELEDLPDSDERILCKILSKDELKIIEWVDEDSDFPESLFPLVMKKSK